MSFYILNKSLNLLFQQLLSNYNLRKKHDIVRKFIPILVKYDETFFLPIFFLPPLKNISRIFSWKTNKYLIDVGITCIFLIDNAFYSLRSRAQAHNRLVADLDSNSMEVVETQSFATEVTTALEKLKEKDVRIILGNFNETWARRIFCEAHK